MKKRFNWIDALICLIVLGVAAFGAYRMLGGQGLSFGKKSHDVTARYQIEINDQTWEFAHNEFKVGDTVFVGEKERTGGIITKVEQYPCYKMTLNSVEGRYDWNRVPDRWDTILTIESDATEDDEVIKAGGQTPLHVGDEYVVRGERAAGLGYLINLNTSDEQEFHDEKDFKVYKDYIPVLEELAGEEVQNNA